MEGGILPSRKELLSRIELVCDLDSSFVMLTGDDGMGKSTLLEFFIEHHCPDYKKCFVQVGTDIEPSQVKEQILFQLMGDQTVDSAKTLGQNLASCYFDEFQRVIIIIDNGELVDSLLLNEFVELLKTPIDNFQASVIIAQDHDLERFSQINAGHPLIEMHIEPLNKAESRMLLEYYYAQMMDSDRLEVQRFIERCEGNPAKLLQWQDGEGKRTKGGLKLSRQAMLLSVLGIVLVGVVGAASWYFVSTAKEPIDLQIDALREKVKEQEQQAQTDEAAGADNEQEQSNLDTLLVQKWDTKAQKAQVDKAIKAAAATAAAELESSEQQNNSEPQGQAEETAPEAVEQGAESVKAQAQNPGEATQTQQQQTKKTDEPQAQSEAAVTEPQGDQVENSEPVQTAGDDAGESTRSDAPDDAAAVTNVEKSTLLDKMDNSWFLAQNDGSVVLQLTGVSELNTLRSYLNYHKLGDKAHVYQSIRNDKPWFVVTYGLFDSLQQANAAKAELPKTLRGEPWAKYIRTIKTEVLNADKKIQ